MDAAFIGGRASAFVTLVGEDVLGDDPVGSYRMTGPERHGAIVLTPQFTWVDVATQVS